MTDKELRDAAWLELAQTTVGYKNLKVKPPTDRNSRWYKAKALLDQIGVVAPPPPPPPPVGDFAAKMGEPRAAFTPSRTIVCSSRAQFDAAMAGLQPGDKLDVRGVVFSGQVNLRKALSGWAEIHFDGGCRFVGGSGTAASVYISSARFLRFYGGDVSNPGNFGILLHSSSDITWRDFRIHDCGGTGLAAYQVPGDNLRLDFRGDISECGHDLSHDPHTELGTGLHGAYVGGVQTAGSPNSTRDSLFVLDVHDQPTGAACEIGSAVSNSEFWVRANRILFDAQQMTAGNAINLFGNWLRDVRVWVEGFDLGGRVVDEQISSGTPAGTVHVFHGRGARWDKDPKYDQTAAIRYSDTT